MKGCSVNGGNGKLEIAAAATDSDTSNNHLTLKEGRMAAAVVAVVVVVVAVVAVVAVAAALAVGVSMAVL